jgi:outer membrane protein OmpA-like peptidoglycan-associated protein
MQFSFFNWLAIYFLFSLPLHANVIGVNTQNFNPTSNGINFVTVQSSQTLEPGIMNLGLFFNYAVNTLPNYQNTTTQTRDYPQDQLLHMDMSIGLGLTKDWDIGITVPQVLWQEVDANSTVFRGEFENTGVTEFRANTKYRLFGDHNGGLATIFTVNWFLIENYPFTGINPGPTLNLELAYDFRVGDFVFATNVGYRWRDPGEPVVGVPVQPFPNEFIFSFAGSYYMSSIDTKFIVEIFNSIPTESVEFTSDREISSSEVIVGAKWDISSSVAVHLGGGTELYHGSASPDWRVYTGINWAIGPLFGRQYESYGISRPRAEFLDEVDFNQAPLTSETFLAKDVLFEFNSTQINDDFRKTLQKLATYIQKGKGFRSLQIVGHTDSVGSDTYNKQLSLKRALSVRRELFKMLPTKDHAKIRAIGKGEENPIADNSNYQGRALNRRVEFNIERDV